MKDCSSLKDVLGKLLTGREFKLCEGNGFIVHCAREYALEHYPLMPSIGQHESLQYDDYLVTVLAKFDPSCVTIPSTIEYTIRVNSPFFARKESSQPSRKYKGKGMNAPYDARDFFRSQMDYLRGIARKSIITQGLVEYGGWKSEEDDRYRVKTIPFTFLSELVPFIKSHMRYVDSNPSPDELGRLAELERKAFKEAGSAMQPPPSENPSTNVA